jgi:hypothetical protein
MSDRRFDRLVVGLPQSTGNASAFAVAADLAEFLQLELLAAFIADAALHDLAGFPAARELRILDQQWQPVDVAKMSQDIEDAVGLARRRFAETVGSRAMKVSFDILAGAEPIVSLLKADDIVAIIEPSHPGESITRQFTALFDAAFESAAAVLVVPRHVVRVRGPIMALANGPEDTSIRVALDIAAALKERLVVAGLAAIELPTEIIAEAQDRGVAVDRLDSGAYACAVPSPQSNERLRVVGRGLVRRTAQIFSTLQGVPLLAIYAARSASPAHKQGTLHRAE